MPLAIEEKLLKTEHRRELELVLLGIALSKADRDKTLSLIAPGDLSKGVEPLINSLRKGCDTSPLTQWLAERLVVIEKNQPPLNCIYNAIDRDNRHAAVKNLAGELNHAIKICDPENLRDRMTEILARLTELYPLEPSKEAK